MLMLRGGGAGAPRSLREASDVFLLDCLGKLGYLLCHSSFGFGFGLGRGLTLLVGPRARFRSGIRRGPASGHANELYGSLPCGNVAERLSEDVCTLSFSAGVGDPEDLPFPQVVQQRHVDAEPCVRVRCLMVGFFLILMIW